jgi:hypothetical protein
MDGQTPRVEVPGVPRPRPPAPPVMGIILPAFATPVTESFVGDITTTFAQQLLPVAVAQGASLVQPDPVTEDFAGKAGVLIRRGVSRRGPA